MAIDPKIIKHKEVLVDREAGTATVNITIYPRNINQPRAKISGHNVIDIATQGGAEIIGIIEDCTINNRYGEASGTWVFEILSNKTPIKKAPKKETKKAPAVEKEEPKEEESSSGFFAKREKKKGNK
jgi:hypothetical protein